MPNTLTITFAETSPDPQGGYRVTYWPTGSPASATVITPNPTSSPVVITGLNGTSYSGTVEAACGGGNYSTPATFTGTAGSSGAATLAVGTTCSNGYGNYTLTGTVGNIVRVRLAISGLLTPTSISWVSASMGSTSPNFSASGTTGCYQPGSSQGVTLNLFKNITIPVGGVVNINTSIFTNNSTASMMSASLTIMTVNGGNNTSTGTTTLNGVCVGNSSTGGTCPGASYIGD
jgi:hypothetical protein